MTPKQVPPIFLHDNDNSYVNVDCSKVKKIALP